MTDQIKQAQIIHGCMRISKLEPAQATRLLQTAVDVDITFFDHADIYGQGASEEVFGRALRDSGLSRDKLVIQTKCGIRSGYYDFSKQHIIQAVEGSLKRLGTDYVDVLLLHRPDALVEPEEVAEAFDSLESSGKVRYFGVSNQSPGQMELLANSLSQKIMFNQLQFSLLHTGMIDAGINVNTRFKGAIDHDGGVLDYCRLNKITIQPWSPLQHGFIEGVFLGHPSFKGLNEQLDKMASDKGVSSAALAIAWILRHPAKMQPIVGTTKASRLEEISKAMDVQLSRQEWYELYLAAGNELP